ncbi:efflux RND transporter periplasmic adaptor subunit [Acidovorax soli]|uniref:efflux RND transporter periplasmic adaptor subunit n=1 Tax=Acidovorax soli TaxID=592050 RepID=UPI0032B2A0BD
MSTALAPLREELLLHQAPRSHDGAPAWTLEDPGRGKFFQIGWVEAEMLARWHLAQATHIAETVSRETSLALDATEVDTFARFLDTQGLLRQQGPQASERYSREARAQRSQSWLSWLMHHYLFIRIPLLRPDAWLARGLPLVRRIFITRGFALVTACAGLLGLFLAARQWDVFRSTFLHFFTLEGALIAGVTLAATKVLHELGHAFAAKHHGCRVATMGVAFMVMWPVLYTDASGAWRLNRRRQRMAIGAAGILTETALAAWATLAWSFLPDGMLRSAAFTLATTTWLLTLAVNLNPFMRFDGYFLLADALNVPNLQHRAFALARWRLREWLFGFGDPKPEAFAPWRERCLVAYALLVWVYRFFLFMGIALLVYHLAFKVLGLVLFAIEIVYFVINPIAAELHIWAQRLRGPGPATGRSAPDSGPTTRARLNRRSLTTLSLLISGLFLLALPWQSRVSAPALARAGQHMQLHAPTSARIERLLVAPGQTVRAGTPLFVLNSPELRHELLALQRRMQVLTWQRDFHAVRQDTAGAVPTALRELQAAGDRLAVLQRQQAQLSINATFDGVLADAAEPLAAGEWVGAGEWLGTLVAPTPRLVEAYILETDIARVRAGDHARFLPEDPDQAVWPLRVVEVSTTASRRLSAAPELASPNGGGVAAVRAPSPARPEQNTGPDWVPEQAVYRVLLTPTAEASETIASTRLQALRGQVLINGEAQSFLLQAWRRSVAVLVRETGF